jgi:hypothetical protein
MRAGDYAQARPELLALAAHPEKLSTPQLREVKDDLCITAYTIGAPSFSLAAQQQSCADAASEPGSTSGLLLARINAALAQSAADQVEHALRSGDLAGAEAAAEQYATIPGADPSKMANWSGRMWKMANVNRTHPNRATKAALNVTITQLRRREKQVLHLSDGKFHAWILDTATIAGVPMVESSELRAHRILRLRIADNSLPIVALHLDKFAEINDALAARCGCDARTDVGVGPNDFPAYAARLDPENQRSEVLILISGASITQRISRR